MNRPEPIPDVYRLCDLPAGTRYMDGEAGPFTILATRYTDESWVQVVEWPQRTYDGIPADDVDLVLAYIERGRSLGPMVAVCKRIREAIARQADT